MNPDPRLSEVGFDPVRLIETYQAGVWRYLRAMGCEASLADDLTQETFLAILQRPFNDVSPAATNAYLRKTALNLLISHERRAGRVRTVENVEQLDQEWMRWIGDDRCCNSSMSKRGWSRRLARRAIWRTGSSPRLTCCSRRRCAARSIFHARAMLRAIAMVETCLVPQH